MNRREALTTLFAASAFGGRLTEVTLAEAPEQNLAFRSDHTASTPGADPSRIPRDRRRIRTGAH